MMLLHNWNSDSFSSILLTALVLKLYRASKGDLVGESFGLSRSHVVEIGHKIPGSQISQTCQTNFKQTWQAHITVNAHCVTGTRMQKVRSQGHTRPKTDVAASFSTL